MAFRHLPALITAFLLAPALIAAEVRLGPEMAIAPDDPNSQIDVRVVLGPTGIFAVWSDDSRHQVYAAINGARIAVDKGESDQDGIGWPAVAAGPHGFLVVWRHNSKTTGDHVLARRYGFDGMPIDGAPIVLDTAPYASFQFNHTSPSIAIDGTTFLVGWNRGWIDAAWGLPQKLNTVRMREDGPPFDARETTVATGSDHVEARGARALWSGSEFVVTCSVEHAGHAGSSYFYRSITAVRFDRSTTLLSQTPPPPLFDTNFLASLAAAAPSGPDRVTYAWSDFSSSIFVAQTAADGRPLRAPRVILSRQFNDGATAAEVAWNGSEHVLMWVDSGYHRWMPPWSLFAIRLDSSLEPLDAAPFAISSGVDISSMPSLIPTPEGIVIAYTRIDGGVSRAYVRTLGRLVPQPPHRRPAGR